MNEEEGFVSLLTISSVIFALCGVRNPFRWFSQRFLHGLLEINHPLEVEPLE
jgi:hypothetical protein